MKFLIFVSYLLLILYSLSAEDDLTLLRSLYDKGELSRDEWVIESVRLLTIATTPQNHDPIKCGTHVIQSLRRNYHLLSQKTVDRLASIGVKMFGNHASLSRPTGLDATYGLSNFLIHYTTSGSDAVDATDSDADGTPDYIEVIAAALTSVDSLELDEYEFNLPPSDDWYSDNGGDKKYDIYVKSLSWGLYGYVNPEYMADSYSGDNENTSRTEVNAYTSYMVIRNNYSGFPTSETESIQVTIAHEFFHAIQFGYDGWEATWLMEATATWIEDEVFDDINDNYQYLLDWFKDPGSALDLDSSTRWYGSFIFFRYISEHLGGQETIRRIFHLSVDHDSYYDDFSIHTIDEALDSMDVSFEEGLTAMAMANQVLSSRSSFGEYSYEEADEYRAYGIQPQYEESVLLSSDEQTISYNESDLMRNASHNIELVGLNSPMDAFFTPATNSDGEDLLTAWCVIQTPADGVMIYGIGTSETTIPIPSDADSVAIVIVTENEPSADYTYSLTITPEIPLPSKITLLQNFPNPSSGETTLRFFLPDEEENATLTLYDLLGRRTKRIEVSSPNAGFNDVNLETVNIANGAYVVRLKSGSANSSLVISVVNETD